MSSVPSSIFPNPQVEFDDRGFRATRPCCPLVPTSRSRNCIGFDDYGEAPQPNAPCQISRSCGRWIALCSRRGRGEQLTDWSAPASDKRPPDKMMGWVDMWVSVEGVHELRPKRGSQSHMATWTEQHCECPYRFDLTRRVRFMKAACSCQT